MASLRLVFVAKGICQAQVRGGVMGTCPNCKTEIGAPHWKARSTTLWANQHGDCIRIFCDNCGQWSDVTYTDKAMGEIVAIRRAPRENWQLESDKFPSQS